MKSILRSFVLCLTFLLVSGMAFANGYDDYMDFSESVDIENVRAFQEALQKIAYENGGNRVALSKGYDASIDYVSYLLTMAGYKVETQTFGLPFFTEISDPEFEQLTPSPETYLPNDPAGFFATKMSPPGDITGLIEPLNFVLPPAPEQNTSSSGCEAADFADFTAGNVALIQRGSCSFYNKAMNAQNAGAIGVIIFNEGQETRKDAFRANLSRPDFNIPVIFANFEIGNALNEATKTGEVTVSIQTNTKIEMKDTYNLIAETEEGDDDHVIMVGAHLDSVAAGPGINDNGSGSAAILEVALQLAFQDIDLEHKVRFAWWGAEESGLVGSRYYVDNLSEQERSKILFYLNFDMIGSYNYVRYVFDGDGSDTPTSGPAGSGDIEKFFVDYFKSVGLETDPAELTGRTDYVGFLNAGIPIGGLFTGAGSIKTERQAKIYGGTAGLPLDPYYHTPDDTIENVNFEVEEQNLKAIAATVFAGANEMIPMPKRVPAAQRAMSGTLYNFEYEGPFIVR